MKLILGTYLDLIIVGADRGNQTLQLNSTQVTEIQNLCSLWQVRADSIEKMVHDRYIETNKIKILLSSGLYHLCQTSKKDFTYIIEIK